MTEPKSSTYRYPIQGATREYFNSPLTDEAHDALTAWVQSVFHAEQSAFVDSLKTEKQQQLAIQAIIREAAGLQWTSPMGQKYIGTVEGMMRLLYEGCRVNEPTLEFAAFKRDIFEKHQNDASAVRASRIAFEACNPTTGGTPNPKAEVDLTKRARSQAQNRKSPKKQRTR